MMSEYSQEAIDLRAIAQFVKETTMGPLEKAFLDRKYNQGRSDTDEHQRIWQHLDAMSAYEVTGSNPPLAPHAEALRVAVEALEKILVSDEVHEIWYHEIARAALSIIRGK